MVDELLDLVDESDQIIGELWKSKAHKGPKLIHREVAIIIHNDKSKVLFQKRSTNTPLGWFGLAQVEFVIFRPKIDFSS
jgi:isopentenyldiphosphate isomerase